MDEPCTRILKLLEARGPMKAKDIAQALELDRSEVNRCLYGTLKGRVQQDKSYLWRLANGSSTGSSRAEPAPGSELFRYYLECLAAGGDEGVSVFQTSQFDKPDHCELDRMPLAPEAAAAFEARDVQAFLSRGGGRKPIEFRLGLPVLVVERRSKKGFNFRKVEPVLLWSWPVGSAWNVLEEASPTLNLTAVASLEGMADSQALEEVLQLTRELGLEDGQEVPDLDDVLARLQALRPHWPWVEPPDPAVRGTGDPVVRIRTPGLYNRAVLVAVEASKFTVGLREELGRLEKGPTTTASALGRWILETRGTSVEEAPKEAAGGDLLEILPLNPEQRLAIERALSEPLTVITGPPGTGKSQVVASLLLNAAHRGLRVLFASKNHQAVDVVETRVNALSDAPILMRLGARGDQNRRLADYLDRLLSTTAGPEDRQALKDATNRLETLQQELRAVDAARDRFVEARNQVDLLEREAEAARAALGEDRFRGVGDLDLDEVEADLRDLARVAARAHRPGLPWLERTLWFALRRSRQEALAGACDRLRPRPAWTALMDLPATAEGLVSALGGLEERLDLARKAAAYLRALRELAGLPPLEELNRREFQLREALIGASADYWRAWMTVRPSNLDREQRRVLSDYVAVLRLLVKSQEQDDGADKGLWRQYFELSEKAVDVLTLWAVTSLSAKGRVPFVEAMFDLLVIDEASQCDIASALPLLFRARRAVIIGDPQQLRHISAVSPSRDRQLQHKNGLGPEWASWSYSVSSLYDLARRMTRPEDLQMLRDHHRSHPGIIEFPNRHFYGGMLRVVTRLDRLRGEPGDGRVSVRWIHVQGTSVRPPDGGLYNQEEAQAVVREMRRLVVDQKYPGTVGVISPFRMQANRIRDLVAADRELERALEQREFACDTVHRFQGDERDLVLFSPAVSQGAIGPALAFLGGQPHLFNVAITRARACLVVVGDLGVARAAEAGGVEYLGKFAEYVLGLDGTTRDPVPATNGPEYPSVSNPHQVSDWERVLYRALYEAGVPTVPQFAVDKYLLDLAVLRGDRRLDIEVDGERYHRAWDGDVLRDDQLRNARLIELGWDVMRFWVYQVRDDLSGCVERVKSWVEDSGH